MPDMLVKLFELPEVAGALKDLESKGIVVRRAVSPEQHVILPWVEQRFSKNWASECACAFARQPPACFIATEGGKLVGFACYDGPYKGYFGPTGVSEDHRGHGIGKVLLLLCLQALREAGYAYGIIGWAGPAEFYAKTVGAVAIEGSMPPVYAQLLRA